MARIFELRSSRQIRFDGPQTGTSLDYLVIEAADEDAVVAALAGVAPYTFNGFTRVGYTATPSGGGIWMASVPYGVPDGNTPPALFPGETLSGDAAIDDPTLPDLSDLSGDYLDPFADYPGTDLGGGGAGSTGGGSPPSETTPLGPEHSFDTTGGTRTVRAALLDESKGGAASRYFGRVDGPTPRDFKGAVGIRKADKHFEVEGAEVPAPKLEFSTTRTVRAISFKYIRLLTKMTATVNKVAFCGYAPGELLFLGASGQYKPPSGQGDPGGWSITFRFATAQNRGLPLGDESGLGIEIADGLYLPPGETWEGWDRLEVLYEDEVADGQLVPRAVQFAIHRIFERTDFRYLGLGKYGF